MSSNRLALTRRSVVAGLLAASIAPRAHAAVSPPTDDLIGELSYYVTKGEDILLDVARAHDLGILEISASNPGVDVWVPGAERLITLPTAHLLPDAPRKGIVINVAELRMFWFRPDGVVETHPIGVGRDGLETPSGQTKIVRKQERPSWYPTAGKRLDNPDLPAVVPPGPDNPLGEFALYLGWPTYLIHGTNKPYGVGRRLSRGCIRMYPEDIQALYPRIPVGTPVMVVDQTVKLGWHAGELYLEAHPDLEQLTQLEDQQAFTLKPAPEMTAEVLRKAGNEAGRVDWRVLEAELVARRGLPVQITSSPGSPGPSAPEGMASAPPSSPSRLGMADQRSPGSLDGIY